MSIGVKIKNFGVPSKEWGMTMYVTCDSPFHLVYTFEFDEPYLYSLNDWRTLANGSEPIDLGGVSFSCDYYKFTIGYSDSEPEVYSRMCIKKEHLSDELTKAIDKAVRLNLKFAGESLARVPDGW